MRRRKAPEQETRAPVHAKGLEQESRAAGEGTRRRGGAVAGRHPEVKGQGERGRTGQGKARTSGAANVTVKRSQVTGRKARAVEKGAAWEVKAWGRAGVSR